MANAAAVLLDQLMGSHRNAVPGDNVKPLTWSDEDVCKFYICGFCPCDLFTNTRADIGPCLKVHDDKLKEDYEKSGRKGNSGYETDFLHYLERLIRDLDRRISRGRERLHRSAEAKQQVEGSEPSDLLRQLNIDINAAVLKLEELGASGRVDEAKEQMMKLEELERERDNEKMTLVSGVPKTLAGFELDSNDFHEKMELCDICGSFLVIGDTQARVDAHLLGKQHIGYARIRAAIKEIKEERALARRKERNSESSSIVERKEKHSRNSKSPLRKSRSPRRKSRSPRRKSKSPRKKSRSPRRKSRSPRRRSRSPRGRSRSPRRRSRSPRRRSRSPRGRSRSPQRRRRSKSPRKKSKSPQRSRSPRKRSRSPRKRSRSPRRRSRSPRKRSRSPQRKRIARRKSRSPRRRSKSPRKRSRSPQRSSNNNRLRGKSQSVSSNQDTSVPTSSVQTVNPDEKLEEKI